MTDPTPITPRNRAAVIVALIVGLPLVVTLIGLFVAGPLSPDREVAIPDACSAPFVDESPSTTGSDRAFAEIQRFRLFDCGDRFVAVIDGAGAAVEAFVGDDGSVIASVALFDQFGELHERRIVMAGTPDPTVLAQRGTGDPQPVEVDEAVGYDEGSLVIEFVRGRGEEILVRVEVSLTETSGGATIHDDFVAEF